MPRGPNGEPPPFESFPSLNHDWEDEEPERERDADDGLTYADPRDEREERRRRRDEAERV